MLGDFVRRFSGFGNSRFSTSAQLTLWPAREETGGPSRSLGLPKASASGTSDQKLMRLLRILPIMATEEQYRYIKVVRQGGDGIFVITLQKAPENRLDVACCQELIRAYHNIQRALGSDSEGAVILRGDNAKFFCTGLDLDERERNIFASSDGFYPLLATVLDFPFPTIALITGHVFGGACLLTLAHDYRVMNANRGFWQMPPVNAGLHHDGMGSLVRSKLTPRVARKVLLEAHKFTGKAALEDGVVDLIAPPDKMFDVALGLAEKWKSKAKMGVYGLLRNELWGHALTAYRQNSHVHHKETAREPKIKL